MTPTRISVKDVMKHHVDFVDGMKTVKQALDEMQHVETKTLIVNKRHENDEWGIVIISDIARKVLAVDKSIDRTNVYEVMTKPALTIRQDMDIRYCARLFEQFGISRAPVVKHGKIIGIVSYTDMVLKGMCNIE
ncbi:CBS domain-containing protein [sulfur-oxidizing endosymbiont of Gigantopelta aegis]|uniref:CBS domain-containing protein n=1 Tax=sulfur-oxidizing endosymbiont of Gigantopelta aegis TaxID=2794934 RepID=UPI0018DE71C4|nr:CBS domain-containing protein [sulfur-oxidizing endosymbiont of Gigantopelta aegis]